MCVNKMLYDVLEIGGKYIMKEITSSILLSAIAATTIGGIGLTTSVLASGVATTSGSTPYTRVYTKQGNIVSNRALGPNTPWRVGKTITIGGTAMYQVATNEYVKSTDVTYNDSTAPQVSQKPAQNIGNNTNIRVSSRGEVAPVYDDRTGDEINRLPYGEQYKVNRIVRTDTGSAYYQVSSHGWVIDKLLNISGTPTNVEYINGFHPMNGYLGETGENIRDLLYNDFDCNWDALESIPDTQLIEIYNVSNYLGADVGGLYRDVYAVNPNIGGSLY